MITRMVESEELTITTKFNVTGNCRTYEEYQTKDEGANLVFDLEVKDHSLTKEFQELEDWLGEELSPSQKIHFNSVEIDSAEFTDENDFESGKITVTATIKSEKEIPDEDLKYLGEMFMEDIEDRIYANVRGTITYVEEYFDYYSPDYIGGREDTCEIYEKASISSIIDNISIKRLS